MIALWPVSMPTSVSAISTSISCSPKPTARSRGRATTNEAVSSSAPNTPPMSEAVNEADSARAASPRLAIGKPSRIVACDPALPGMPIRIEGKVSETVVTASSPIIIASAWP